MADFYLKISKTDLIKTGTTDSDSLSWHNHETPYQYNSGLYSIQIWIDR